MAEDQDNIRRLAEQLLEEEVRHDEAEQRHRQSNIAAQERMMQARAEFARRKDEKAAEVLEVCGRFAVWGAEHDIPYNSRSIFARGWMLGSRSGKPEAIYPGHGSIGGGADFSKYSILVKTDQSVRELLLYNAAAKQRYDYFPMSLLRFTNDELLAVPHTAQAEGLGDYDMESIEQSIAEFSANSGVEW